MDMEIEIAMNMEIETDTEADTDIGRGKGRGRGMGSGGQDEMRSHPFWLRGVFLCGNVAVLCQPQWRRMDRAGAMDMGLVRKAMAFRVKYRVSVSKKRIALARLGVHPHNRGGMYPQPDTVRNLGLQVLATGFN